MRFVIRIVASAIALAVAAAVVPGIELTTASLGSKALTLIAVALIFGVVNAVLKPIVKTIGCAFYVLTLGLIALVVNALLLWLTSYLAGKLKLPFHITGRGHHSGAVAPYSATGRYSGGRRSASTSLWVLICLFLARASSQSATRITWEPAVAGPASG